MNQRQMSCSIAVEGAVKGCRAKLAVWYDKNEMSFYGELQMDQRGPAGLLEAVNSEMASKFEAYASGLVHASSQRATLSCIHGITALGYGEPGLYFKAAAGRGSAAILFSFYRRISQPVLPKDVLSCSCSFIRYSISYVPRFTAALLPQTPAGIPTEFAVAFHRRTQKGNCVACIRPHHPRSGTGERLDYPRPAYRPALAKKCVSRP